MNKLKTIITSAALLLGITAVFVSPTIQAEAVTSHDPCVLSKESRLCDGETSVNSILRSIINILLFIIAAASVIVIIIGGVMYATSTGEQARTKKAKDTIFYAVIGLAVAIFAYAIMNWVVGALLGGESS